VPTETTDDLVRRANRRLRKLKGDAHDALAQLIENVKVARSLSSGPCEDRNLHWLMKLREAREALCGAISEDDD
jgi:hypothetical protein